MATASETKKRQNIIMSSALPGFHSVPRSSVAEGTEEVGIESLNSMMENLMKMLDEYV